MTTVQQPAFVSPELQAALDKARNTLEGVEEARSGVSRDIKALESYLAGLRLTTPFRYPMGKALVPEDEQSVAASLEFGGCATGKIREEALVLDEDARGKVRLLYETCEWEGYVDVDIPGGPFFWDPDTLKRDIKPLMETKFDIRKQVYKQLPDFVTALAKHYAIDPAKLVDCEDEIPF